MGLVMWSNLIKLRHVRRPGFLLEWLQIQNSSRKQEWMHAVENDPSIFDDVELQIDCQGKSEHVMWKSKKLQCDILMKTEDMQVIYQLCLWGDEYLQNITSGKVEILYLACPIFAESNRTVLNWWKFWLLLC